MIQMNMEEVLCRLCNEVDVMLVMDVKTQESWGLGLWYRDKGYLQEGYRTTTGLEIPLPLVEIPCIVTVSHTCLGSKSLKVILIDSDF